MATPYIRGYVDLTRVGRGGFSVVYRGTQVALDRLVAIKVLLADLEDESQVRRFTSECRVLGRLGHHPSIVDVYDAGVTDDGQPFIVMRFYQRGSLAERMARSGPMSMDQVIDIGIKMAGALSAAHAIGVIHRDVKPDNILVADDGEPVLTDFGVAAVADAAGGFTSSVAFSRAHVAPEVLDRNEFGVASDIYSLGSTLFTLLTGRAAFAADTEARQILAIMNDPVPTIDDSRASLAVSHVIATAMAKRPGDRYSTAERLAEALVAARPLPPESPDPRDRGRADAPAVVKGAVTEMLDQTQMRDAAAVGGPTVDSGDPLDVPTVRRSTTVPPASSIAPRPVVEVGGGHLPEVEEQDGATPGTVYPPGGSIYPRGQVSGGPTLSQVDSAGLAEEGPSPQVASPPPSPASGAAAVPARSSPRGGDPRHTAAPARPHSRRRLVAVISTVLIAILMAGSVVAARAWQASQWYVAVNGDAETGTVAVYRGVEGALLGFSLSELRADSEVLVSNLPYFDQELVSEGIPAFDLADALNILNELGARAAACQAQSPPSGCPGAR